MEGNVVFADEVVAAGRRGQPELSPGLRLTGALGPWVSGKDVILEMLRRFTVKGGVGKVIEYHGPGVASLSATDRATIANMGAELGATSTLFPSDERTREFLEAQGRGQAWQPLAADDGAVYDEFVEINLDGIEPLLACPYSPDNIRPVRELEGTPVGQVITGSSVNSSYRDLMIAVKALEGRTVHEDVSMDVNPGSRQVLINVDAAGGVETLLKAGARIQQSGCLGCIGQGQAPATGTVSLRTFPRNFKGRSGTVDDQVYLCSPETAVAAAIFGKITDPRKLGACPEIEEPKKYITVDENIIFPLPLDEARQVEIVKGPNITTLPDIEPPADTLEGEVLLVAPDNTTTDEILPAGADILKLRSNIPAISQFTFTRLDPDFPARAAEKGGGFVIGGVNYGQGSSREHAALAPAFLKVRAKIAVSFARIHKANLINFGIVPLVFKNPDDYALAKIGACISITGVRAALESGAEDITFSLDGRDVPARLELSPRDRAILLAGGKLNYVRGMLEKE